VKDRLRTLGCLLALVALVAAFFGPTLWGGCSLVPTDVLHEIMLPYSASVQIPRVQNHYTSDALVEDYPWALFWQQTVRAGQLPLWNPYILGGHLHLALSMPALFSPFKLLLLLGSAERAFSLAIVLQFVIAALSMFAFLRALGRSRTAAFLGGAVWALNSSLLMWYWRAPAIFCLAPLVLLLLERGTWASAFAAGGTLGIAFLSGNIQAGAQLGLLCIGYALGGVRRGEPEHNRNIALRMVLALALGALIAAVHWLPTIEALPRDAYAATAARGAQPGVRNTLLGLPMLVTFVFPALTGSTETFDLLKVAGASRGDFTGYIGVVPFALALAAALARRGRRSHVWLGIIAAVLVIIFFTPLVKYFYHRLFIVAVFALAALAAEGVDLALSGSDAVGRALRWMAVCCAAMLVAVAVTQAVVAWKRPAIAAAARRYVLPRAESNAMGFKRDWFVQRVEQFLDSYRVTNPQFWLPAVCGIGVALAWRARERRWFGALLVATALVDVWTLGRPLVPQSDLRRYPLKVWHPVLTPAKRESELCRVSRWGPNAYFLIRPNLLMVDGLYDLGGSFSLSPPTVESLPQDLLDVQNVKYVLRLASEPPLPSERFELVAEADDVRTYSNRRCLPRAWWVPRAELCRRKPTEDFDPRAVVLLEEPVAAGSSAGSGGVEVTRYTPLRVAVRVTSDADGWLVLADTWDAGWRVRVDGEPAKLYRANWVLRGVSVPRGAHEVEFEFSPWTFRVGAAVSLSTMGAVLLGVCSAAVRCRRRRTPSTANPLAYGTADTTP
jgi:hypothetical protein